MTSGRAHGPWQLTLAPAFGRDILSAGLTSARQIDFGRFAERSLGRKRDQKGREGLAGKAIVVRRRALRWDRAPGQQAAGMWA